MEKKFDLMNIFEGYVRNYRRINLHQATNGSMFTKREIDYFANLGEMLGFFSFIEDYKPNKEYGRSRPMDLSWWQFDPKKNDKEHFSQLILHLERENQWSKDTETIEKLFCTTDEDYKPINVIGIQNVGYPERIEVINKLVCQKNNLQNSNVLMIYRYFEKDKNFDRIKAYYFEDNIIVNEKFAISDIDRTGYWRMCFDEEYEAE